MSNDIKGVFVRLPLSEDQAHVFLKESRAAWDECNGSSDGIACESGLLSIGIPVTGDELYPVGYINEDAIGGLACGIYQSASIFRDKDADHHDDVALTRMSVALAKLAERDAEIARLREVLSLFTAYESLMDDGECAAAVSAYANFQLKVHEALKGPEA